MRIAFFVTQFPKFSEVFILNQALALLDRGHDVQVFSLTRSGEAEIQPGVDRLQLEGRIHDAGMPRWELLRWPGFLASFSRLGPGELRKCLDYRRFGREARTLRNFYRLRAVRGQLDGFDVAHAQFGEIGLQCAMLRELGVMRAPLVTSFRGNDLSGYIAGARPGVYQAVFDNSAFCLPVAERWRKRLQDMGCPASKIRTLPSGIPVTPIVQRTADSSPENVFPAIVSACRLEPHKGIDLGLEAFGLLREAMPGATWDIFGDGPDRSRLEAKALRMGLGASVRWHGYVAHADMLRHVAAADMHWFTSITLADGRTEGVPTILKETQAAGLPAIAFDHPGVAEVVVDGETGLLVPEGDARALAGATAGLARDPALMRRMGERGSILSRHRFDLASLTDRLEQIYREAQRLDRVATSEGGQAAGVGWMGR